MHMRHLAPTQATSTEGLLLIAHREAARLLGISERLLWTLANRGEVPSIRIGRCRRYPVEELRRWVEARLQRGAHSERGR